MSRDHYFFCFTECINSAVDRLTKSGTILYSKEDTEKINLIGNF